MARLQITKYERELIEEGKLVMAIMQYAMRTGIKISKSAQIIKWYSRNLANL